MDPLRVEAIAEEIAARMEGRAPEDVAAAYECAYAHIQLPKGWWGHHIAGLIFVTLDLVDAAMQRLVTSHEGAHGTLQEQAANEHQHGDVWAVALAVLMPRAQVKPFLDAGHHAVAEHFGVPTWAAKARLEMVREIEGEPAHGCARVIKLR